MTFNNGALIDNREPEAKEKTWLQKEVLAAAQAVVWKEKTQAQWRKFPIFDQDGSGSCVMQTQCKELGIMRWLLDGIYVHFSVADGYQRRYNKPDGGMAAYNARDIAAEGITLEVLAPSQGMSDQQLDSMIIEAYKRDVGAVFKVPNHLEIAPRTIEAVASTIQATGKGVMVWFYFTGDEWTNTPSVLNPNLNLTGASTLRHSVTAVDFALVNGVKCLIIEDSWGPGAAVGGQRVITEAFFNARCWYAGYLINFKFQGQPNTKPQAQFDTDMEFGMTNTSVKGLQDCLRWAGFFPANADSTGYYGAITKKAVGNYQIARGVVASATSAGYGRCGPATRAKLNAEFK